MDTPALVRYDVLDEVLPSATLLPRKCCVSRCGCMCPLVSSTAIARVSNRFAKVFQAYFRSCPRLSAVCLFVHTSTPRPTSQRR